MPSFVSYSETIHRRLLVNLFRRLTEGGSGPSVGNPRGCDPSCASYHVGWLGLQCLGLISGLWVERHGIVTDLRSLEANHRLRRVLIAGCADFGLLSVVHEAFGARVKEMELVVADRCPTPLQECSDYAQEFGFDLRTETLDLTDPSAEGKFDLILGHSILSFFAPDRRADLLIRLARRLAPEGVLSLYQSVRPESSGPVLAYAPAEIQRLEVESAERLERSTDLRSWLTRERAGRMVRDFCSDKKTYPVVSVTELEECSRAVGLVVTAAAMNLSRVGASAQPLAHRAASPAGAYQKYSFLGQLRPPR
jgi:hypothetical protein